MTNIMCNQRKNFYYFCSKRTSYVQYVQKANHTKHVIRFFYNCSNIFNIIMPFRTANISAILSKFIPVSFTIFANDRKLFGHVYSLTQTFSEYFVSDSDNIPVSLPSCFPCEYI